MYDVILYPSGELQMGSIIHSGSTQNRLRKFTSGMIVDEDNSISSFTFEMLSTNPGYNSIIPRQSHVKVRDNVHGRDVFVGRVLDISPEMNSSGIVFKTVTCEDRRGYLLDSVQPFREIQYYEDDGDRNGLQVFIDLILDNHNAQVEEYKKIYRGNVTVKTFKTTDGCYKQLNWETTWDVIKNKLLDSYGGHLLLREADGKLYLDYLEEVGTLSDTAIEVGKNMLNAKENIDPKDLITRLVPLGTKLTTLDEEGNTVESEERLTITEVNDGKPYIEAQGYVEQYGIVYGTMIWDDVTEAANLLSKGTDYLAAHNALTITADISALNLSAIGMGEGFELYSMHPVVNKLIGLNETMQIVKTSTNIINVERSSFVLGDVSKTLSDALMAQQKLTGGTEGSIQEQVQQRVDRIVESYVHSYTAGLEADVTGLKGNFTEQTHSVSELGEFRSRLINFFTADAGSMTATFGDIIEEITGSQPGDMNYLKNLVTNFRFSAEGLDIGRAGDPVNMRLTNSKLSFYNNGVEVAYISDNKLYITDAQFLNSIIIGNYQFILETNGSLSLVLAKNRR